jgi:hypothetical protein
MGVPAMQETVIRYTKAKAIGFGLFMLALGALTVWVATELVDPLWVALSDDGVLLQIMPRWIRTPLVVLMGIVVLIPPGVAMLWAGLTGRVIVRADAAGIAARTIFGRLRRIRWGDIVAARRKQNRIMLSPAGVDTIDQRIWDRKSVLLDVGMLEGGPAVAEALIRRYRPDLVIVSEPA